MHRLRCSGIFIFEKIVAHPLQMKLVPFLKFYSQFEHFSATERIVGKAPHLVNVQKDDKHTALHVAAINDHQDIANILLLKARK